MIWITLLLVLGFVISLVLIKCISLVLSKFKEAQCDGSILDLIMDFPKLCLGILVLSLLLSLYTVKYQIGQMYDCSVRSTVQKVETQYSWYFDVCQFKNKDGVWIDFKQVRGTPDAEVE